jgi:hypothetical protein
MTEYNKSNKIETINISKVSKTIINKTNTIINKKTYTPNDFQILSDMICKTLRIENLPIKLKGARPTSNRGTTHGTYTRNINKKTFFITLYGITPKTKKIVAPKTLIKTLIHEIMHHYDFEKLGFNSSNHTTGFYKRISFIEKMIFI